MLAVASVSSVSQEAIYDNSHQTSKVIRFMFHQKRFYFAAMQQQLCIDACLPVSSTGWLKSPPPGAVLPQQDELPAVIHFGGFVLGVGGHFADSGCAVTNATLETVTH